MSFYNNYTLLKQNSIDEIWQSTTLQDVKDTLCKETLTDHDFLILLSPVAQDCLQEMADKAHRVTQEQFNKRIELFTPMYIADYCVNHCSYCSFSVVNSFDRKKLTLDQIEEEAREIAKTGIRSILILTGESPVHTPVSYIKASVEVLKKYFTSIFIEVNPLETDEYSELVQAGVDGLTIYQEVYNENKYKEIHLKGPKRIYKHRLDAPERGCQAGMKNVTIGALLGLADWRKEVYFTGMHAHYLMQQYPDVSISLSFPRIRPHVGQFQTDFSVEDQDLMQAIFAYRLFQPQSGITLSTRESAELRNQLMQYGITKMSAGVSTEVGGYSHEEKGTKQFEISDERSVQEIADMIIENGYKPIFCREKGSEDSILV